MGDVTWQLHADRATLVCGPLRAAIDVRQPSRGLHDLSVDERRFAGCEFLGVAIDAGRSDAVADCYGRAGDLIVRYAQTDDRPFAVSVYWRAGLAGIGSMLYPYVDLVVSVETSLLDSRPQIEATTSLATSSVVALNESTGGCLARFPRLALTYLEMVHPDDAISPLPEKTAVGVRLATRLFGQRLEKGVVLRSRLRGMFVPLSDDRKTASDARALFAAAPPPLTA
jgi:hypothetical protein